MIRKNLHNAETARKVMGKLYSLVGILDVKEEDCVDALASPIADYEEAVVEQVARRSGVEYIVTGNIKDYDPGLTKTFLSDEFIRFMEQTE